MVIVTSEELLIKKQHKIFLSQEIYIIPDLKNVYSIWRS